ncbi:ABC transporter substrate-binding protein [Vreelandella alkaliphila]|uniref:ABC transporter substrate-binding protein n=1 Tax=Vreelandella alkaliphila TaxID=272774 RepID=UPI003F94DD88
MTISLTPLTSTIRNAHIKMYKLKYRNATPHLSALHKQAILSITLLVSLLISNVSMASDENSEVALAAFDFAIAETLNAIGYPPKFLAGLEDYETYARQDGIIPLATNLGYRHLPNLELLASLPPQHILISPPAHVSLIPKLREIADVQEYLLYNFSDNHDEQNHWNVLEDLTRMLGNLVNDPDASEYYIEQTNSHFDDLKRQLNHIDKPLLIVRLMDERHARVHGNGSVEGMVLNRLGLQNAWQEELGQWGFKTVSAASVFDINAKLIFLDSPYGPEGGQRQLISDGQWRHWPSIQQNNYAILPLDFWSWGGLPAAQRFADSLASHLTEDGNTIGSHQ